MKNLSRLVLFSLLSLTIIAAGGTGQNPAKTSRGAALTPEAVKAINEMGADLEKLNQSHRNLMQAVSGLDDLYVKLVRKAQEVCRLAAEAKKSKGDPTSQLFKATEQMQEMQMSFNLQYLMLQNKISHENRQFSMISNIMKNKHDTAKNSINNIR
jgi:hypothetical protein